MTGTQAILVSSGDVPASADKAVAHVPARLAGEAARLCRDPEVAERSAEPGLSSAVVLLNGAEAEAMAQDREVVILRRGRSAHGARRRPPAAGLLRFDPEEVTMPVAVLAASARTRPPARSGRAGSILRGRPWSAVVRYDSSQRQNRQGALDRLAALVAGDRAEAEATRRVFERPEFREA